jgi:hypothetical protein
MVAIMSGPDRSNKWLQLDRDPRPGWAQYFAQGACQAMEDPCSVNPSFSAAGAVGDHN